MFTGRDKEGHGRRGKERGEQGESPGSQLRPAGHASHGNPGKAFMNTVQCTPAPTRPSLRYRVIRMLLSTFFGPFLISENLFCGLQVNDRLVTMFLKKVQKVRPAENR